MRSGRLDPGIAAAGALHPPAVVIGSFLVAGIFASIASAGCPAPGAARIIEFDQAGAAAGFRVSAGAVPLKGSFRRLRGQLAVASSGARACVRAELDAHSVVMATERFGKWARSPEFFDATTYPRLEFQSKAFDPVLLRRGGDIDGTLTVRGQARGQRLRAEPLRCSRKPKPTCTLQLRGAMSRSAFGMRARRPFVGDRVHLDLRIEAPRAALFAIDDAGR